MQPTTHHLEATLHLASLSSPIGALHSMGLVWASAVMSSVPFLHAADSALKPQPGAFAFGELVTLGSTVPLNGRRPAACVACQVPRGPGGRRDNAV